MTRCPICELPSAGPFLTRHNVSVHQNLVVDTADAARALRAGTLCLHACENCGFVFNASFDPSLLQYGRAYDNSQTCSEAFRRHVESRVDHLVLHRGARNADIVEVGCGKGDFLVGLAQRDALNRGVGFDPSYAGPDTAVGGRVRFERRFYDDTCGSLDPDVVVCRHVIEHVQRPVDLLRTIRGILSRTGAQVFFETPCVEWILENEVVWDFFYEHCSYFSAGSLGHAFERAGFAVDSVSHVFGGQYLWAEGHAAARAPSATVGTSPVPALAKRYAAREAVIVHELRERVAEFASAGPVALWGAAAKGTTLANLVDPDATLLTCLIDINPNKRGKFLAGSAHRIVGPGDIASLGIRTALVMNPNYIEENARIVRDHGLALELVDAMRSSAHADTD